MLLYLASSVNCCVPHIRPSACNKKVTSRCHLSFFFSNFGYILAFKIAFFKILKKGLKMHLLTETHIFSVEETVTALFVRKRILIKRR